LSIVGMSETGRGAKAGRVRAIWGWRRTGDPEGGTGDPEGGRVARDLDCRCARSAHCTERVPEARLEIVPVDRMECTLYVRCTDV
jgi:hypothetical protein